MTTALLAHLEAGASALDRGDFDAAAAAFAAARALAPGELGIVLALANARRLADDVEGARTALVEAHGTMPWRDAAAGQALGAALLEVGAPREARDCFARVVRLRPGDPAALSALASATRAAGDPAAAWPLARKAVTLAPRGAAFLLTAAQVRHDLGDRTGALHWLDRAERIRPDHAPTRLQRAYTTLIGGASAAGWALWEHRPLPVPTTAARPWHGEPLAGDSILLTAEQGMGDQFQFLRFVADVTARGAGRVVVECHERMVRLLRANGLDAVPRGEAPGTDWHAPLLSLPHRLGLDADVRGDRVPYLRAPAGEPSGLPPRGPRPRFGLVWAGNRAFPGRVTRDFDPALLPSLVADPAVEWYSLQHDEAPVNLIAALLPAPVPRDWAHTAAMLAELDGLVTTDTGIAHLAGAMGVRTWVLLQHVPDWRWGLSDATTPWYPTLRLVRQRKPGDWASAVRALHGDPAFLELCKAR